MIETESQAVRDSHQIFRALFHLVGHQLDGAQVHT